MALGAVAMLGNDDVGDALALRIVFESILAMDEHNCVSIFIQAAIQVSEDRNMIRAAFHRTRNLRNDENRHS